MVFVSVPFSRSLNGLWPICNPDKSISHQVLLVMVFIPAMESKLESLHGSTPVGCEMGGNINGGKSI